MIKVNFTPFPNLTTERLILRQVESEDLNEFFILKSDPDILKFLDYDAKSLDEARQFLIKTNEGIVKKEWVFWGIAKKDDNKLIGTICLWNISFEQSKAEVGYELMTEYQGKGIMQEAMASIIDYGFKVMKLQIIEAITNPDNIRSINLLEKNKFIRGENFQETDLFYGKILNRVIYSLNNYI